MTRHVGRAARTGSAGARRRCRAWRRGRAWRVCSADDWGRPWLRWGGPGMAPAVGAGRCEGGRGRRCSSDGGGRRRHDGRDERRWEVEVGENGEGNSCRI
jgi:hypothetical protein